MSWKIDETVLARCRAMAEGGRVIAFDTETTGLTACDQIVQLAAVEYVGGKETRTFSHYLVPTCPISPEAEAVHGLSRQFLRAHGRAPAEVLAEFFAFVGEGALLVAHNAPFDFRMLRGACAQFGPAVKLESFAFCDTLRLAKRLVPGLCCYSLATLIAELKLDGANSHDALDDTRACGELFFELVRRIPAPGDCTCEPDRT